MAPHKQRARADCIMNAKRLRVLFQLSVYAYLGVCRSVDVAVRNPQIYCVNGRKAQGTIETDRDVPNTNLKKNTLKY